jgi:hypothetical protein
MVGGMDISMVMSYLPTVYRSCDTTNQIKEIGIMADGILYRAHIHDSWHLVSWKTISHSRV